MSVEDIIRTLIHQRESLIKETNRTLSFLESLQQDIESGYDVTSKVGSFTREMRDSIQAWNFCADNDKEFQSMVGILLNKTKNGVAELKHDEVQRG